MDDTIFALASARGRAGVSVVRLSGPASWAAVAALAGDVPAARRASLRVLRSGGDVLDTALVIAFERGRSFTGEESAELHLHGSVATVAAVLSALGELPLRPAEPGEFTRRALENGRLDLTQVEGLADLIDAETEAQRRQALRVLSGAVGRRAASWRDGLLRAAALVEATIDFADEDIPLDVRPEAGALLDSVHAELLAEKRGFQAAERIREGFEVAIVGEPNAGKSTLLNRLAGRDAAITSEIAGTTRDVIEVRMDIGGMAVTLLDTAGLRGAADPVEAMGVARAIRRAEAADLRVFLSTGTVFPMLAPGGDDIVVQAKGDLGARAGAGAGLPGVSGLTGLGVDWLVAEIGRRLQPLTAGPAAVTRARQRKAVERAIAALERARALLDGASPELVAEEIRHAVRGLDFLIGRIDVEDVLGEIFGSFCIGK
ncbi:MAG: tRNA uridine-5-carboxymethylaminomethyl(34) synthesis GTPase MnmE [Pseudomonadota bacterium]